jgi:Sec-independent protein translocase protein TatA
MAVFQLGRFIKDYKSVAKGTDAKKRKERPEGSDDEEPNPKKPKPNGKDEL